MKEIIYVYTTETYKTKNWYKIGMTNQESGSVRISQQDGTSNPSNIGEIFTVNATVTKSMIEDLENQHGFDLVQRLESLLVLTSIRRSKIKKVLSKI